MKLLSISPSLHILVRLWGKISDRRRMQFQVLFILMVIVSFSEFISIGVALPFLGVLVNPNLIFQSPQAIPFINFFGISSPGELLFFITIGFIGSALLSGFLRGLLLWCCNRLSFAAGGDVSIDIYRRTLYQPYIVQISRSSSQIINGVSKKAATVTAIIAATLTLLTACVILLTVLIALFFIDPIVSILCISGFSFIYLLIIRLTKNRQFIYSELMARESTQVIKSLQEGLGGIRDILIDGTQELYCKIYRDSELSLRRAQCGSLFISQCPRYLMETLGMVLIALMGYWLTQMAGEANSTIPILGAFAYGAQRVLPVMQQMYQSWATIQAQQVSLRDVLDLLDQPLPVFMGKPVEHPIVFSREISLKQIGFRYGITNPWVLRGITLNISKGERVGFFGASGSGKSTLLNILMGLLEASEGQLEVDGKSVTPSNIRSWQSLIAHVPQTIFLADSTIEENIAFGIPRDQINHKRVKIAAKMAQIEDVIESWELGYQTIVGECGIRLSGGQRQRIGIARALYKKAAIIIFDEATSSLDSKTEQEVMNIIEGLGSHLTLLIIAHRVSTLKVCNRIVEVGNFGINRIGTFEEIFIPPNAV